jgi:predicted dehydrogenase
MGLQAAKLRVGIIGCGNISGIYMKNCRVLPGLKLVACADALPERAEAKAREHGIDALSVDALLESPEIDLVVDLTVPAAHSLVNQRALGAGKHVYSEKPLAVTRAEGEATVALAESRGLRVGCAPDTFLGAGLQTCINLIDQGVIGEPVAAVAFMAGHGPESWHPDPAFFYKQGAGPMFDMGPYYLTTLIAMLGPVARISGVARKSFAERIATSEARKGERLPVEVPTHYASTLEFASGPVASLLISFDVWAHNLPRIEVYGSEGSLSVPDPNTFGGPVRVKLAGDAEWREAPLAPGYTDNSRGLGASDMALAIAEGRPHRASGQLALHVLDLMESAQEAYETAQYVKLRSSVTRPAPLPVEKAVG